MAAAERSGYACARCGNAVSPQRQATADLTAAALHGIDLGSLEPGLASADEPLPTELPPDDLWDLDPELRKLRASIPALRRQVQAFPPSTHLGDELLGLGAAQLLQAGWPPAPQPTGLTPLPSVRRAVWVRRLTAAAGLVAIGVGVGLTLTSWRLAQPGLWWPGVLAVVAGHAALLLACLLWLGQIGRRSHEVVQRLAGLDHRLRDLHHCTQLLSATRGSAAQAFYAHLAEGASPNLLVADLKGQLDLLALRLARRSGR